MLSHRSIWNVTPIDPTSTFSVRVALVPIAWLLFHWRKQGRPDTFVLGAYLMLAGTIRFLIEFLRTNVRVLGPFSVAHLASLKGLRLIIGKPPAGTRADADAWIAARLAEQAAEGAA